MTNKMKKHKMLLNVFYVIKAAFFLMVAKFEIIFEECVENFQAFMSTRTVLTDREVFSVH